VGGAARGRRDTRAATLSRRGRAKGTLPEERPFIDSPLASGLGGYSWLLRRRARH